jgi:ubiquinol-cytochrome c reductase cytochrome b subunit
MSTAQPVSTTVVGDRPAPAAGAGAAIGGVGRWMDARLGGAGFVRKSFNKVFPDHWSFMIGEIALYSFIILLLSGTYLTLFFKASSQEVLYHGSYVPLRGIPMTEAYASTLDLSFDVRAGLLFRQIHHWSALMFVAAICVHLARVYFTGAFRKPRELNWLIGNGLLTLALVEGFAGYSLPDDLLSGTGLRIAFSIMESVPLVGSYLSFFLFGGEFPGHDIISRLYAVHILLVPALILGLISAHMAIVWHQKHTDFPGPGKTEHNVVGTRFFPTYMAKAGGFFFLCFGVTALLGGLAQINPIWLYGPYEAKNVSAGSQPDWYIGWLDGTSRLMPGWEIRAFGHTVPPIFWAAAVLPGIIFTLMALYPWIEAKVTGDHEYHNLLDRPRDRPVRTAIGTGSLSFYFVLMLSGGNDVLAKIFHISLNATTFAGRIGAIIAPPITFIVTYKTCKALQRREELEDEHGTETGYLHMLPTGEFVELHAPRPEPTAKPRQIMPADELPALPAAPSGSTQH